MKNTIVFLLLLLQVGSVGAQGPYTVTQTLPFQGTYQYTILPNFSLSTPKFTDLDLVTWIFPDGQFKQHEVRVDASNNIVAGTNIITWVPYNATALNVPDEIKVYVAKKGGTGNPTLTSQNVKVSVMPMASFPETFAFQPNQTWQINRSWEFAPGFETFLILSYKNLVSPGCAPDTSGIKFRLFFNSDQVIPVQPLIDSSFGFSNQSIGANANQSIEIKLPSSQNDPVQQHVFIKLKSTAEVGDSIIITAIANICAGAPDTMVLRYVTSGGPHDPNNKTVDIETICSNQSDAIKLTYTIQFHNDGNAPVEKVDVIDDLPTELNSGTFVLGNPLEMNGIDYYTHIANGTTQTITFMGIGPPGSGLPGLGQTNLSYCYDQTIYRFSFEVYTVPIINTFIDNEAKVVFYDLSNPNNPIALDPIFTNVARVTVVDPKPGVECYGVPTFEIPDVLGSITLKPNPFQEQTVISFELLEKSKLRVEVRDTWGRLITAVASGEYAAGTQQFTWDGASTPDGVYFLFFHTEKGSFAKRVVKVQ